MFLMSEVPLYPCTPDRLGISAAVTPLVAAVLAGDEAPPWDPAAGLCVPLGPYSRTLPRASAPLGSYRRTMPRALWWS